MESSKGDCDQCMELKFPMTFIPCGHSLCYLCAVKNFKCHLCGTKIEQIIQNWKLAGLFSLNYPRELPPNSIAIRHDLYLWFNQLVAHIKQQVDTYQLTLDHAKHITIGRWPPIKGNLMFPSDIFTNDRMPIILDIISRVGYYQPINDRYAIWIQHDTSGLAIVIERILRPHSNEGKCNMM